MRSDRRLAEDLRAVQKLLEKRTNQLAKSEARFRDMVERNADAHVVVDEAGIIQFANEAATQLFGLPRDKLVGTPFGLPVGDGETREVDLTLNGSRIVEMRVVLSEWEGSMAYIASLRDVTERKQAEQTARRYIREQAALGAVEAAERQAMEASQEKADFLATISHDLRTPLTAIVGYADLLEMGVPQPIPDDCLDRVARIRTSANQLRELLNELVAVGRDEPPGRAD